jgi:hypothetical protein
LLGYSLEIGSDAFLAINPSYKGYLHSVSNAAETGVAPDNLHWISGCYRPEGTPWWASPWAR